MDFYTKDTKIGKLVLIKNDDISNMIDFYGVFAPMEIVFLNSILKEDDVVIELGSNIGTHTIPIGKTIGKNGTLITFEPQRIVFQVLCTNLILNNIQNTTVYNYGIGKKNIDLEFSNEYNSGGLALKELNECTTNNINNIIKVRNIKEFPELDKLKKLDLIFMDVERMELEVLEEFEEMIKKFSPNILVEVYFETFIPVRNFLKNLGYKIYQFIPNNTQYEPKTTKLQLDMPLLFASKNYSNPIGLIEVSNLDKLDLNQTIKIL